MLMCWAKLSKWACRSGPARRDAPRRSAAAEHVGHGRWIGKNPSLGLAHGSDGDHGLGPATRPCPSQPDKRFIAGGFGRAVVVVEQKIVLTGQHRVDDGSGSLVVDRNRINPDIDIQREARGAQFPHRADEQRRQKPFIAWAFADQSAAEVPHHAAVSSPSLKRASS